MVKNLNAYNYAFKINDKILRQYLFKNFSDFLRWNFIKFFSML